MKEFNMNDRLDLLFMNLFSRHVELREVVKLVILSLGNAGVESGFSANEEMVVENMSESSLVAQRMVFDDVMNEGGISNVDVNRSKLKFVNNAHCEYVKQLKNREQQTSGEKKRAEKRKITNELKKVKEAKRKFTEQHKQKTVELGSHNFNIEEQLRKT